ncbi:MAG: DUF2975 domain-containing protein [Gammaproteobacteria bacterium]|nr:DUF2975 domain-containing protein [Gammaproteobacteria bacterium]
MTRRLSLFISWICTALLVAIPLAALYFLVNIGAFAALTQKSIGLAVDWSTVVAWQWYALWAITFLYVSIGLLGFFYLRRPFANFARGELFNSANSRDLRRFSILLFVQALAKPIHFAAASVLLSANHSAGNKILSISVGSNEVRMIAIAVIIWVVSNLLIEGCKLQSENQQFV